MNLKELEALADNELIEEVAMKGMGWEKKPYTWKFTNEGVVESYKRCGSQVHMGHNFEWYGGEEFAWNSEWNPLTDWNHTMQVVEKIRQKTGCFTLCFATLGSFRTEHENKWACHFKEGGECSFDNNPQRAILLAALLAISSQA